MINIHALYLYRLSEANCVEIISTLITNGAINLVVTTNGKEYVTKRHLITEVKNECLAAGGRINITELVPILRIELDHIETAASNLVSEYPDEFLMCAGELVSREYINNLCKRLNESLDGVGQLSMLQLAKNWDLPIDLLNHYVRF
jgi:deoxyhypusine synthase